VSPDPDIELKVGDILVLVGAHRSLDRAFTLLDVGE
jgi:K+/H+ antiporter YhaU regulatory subunit KhtT